MLIIRKLGRAKFRIYHQHKPTEAITLDFNPLIRLHNLTGDFELHHFQARPKPERSFGFYSSSTDSYEAYTERDLPSGRMIAIDESRYNVVPSSVYLCFSEISIDPMPRQVETADQPRSSMDSRSPSSPPRKIPESLPKTATTGSIIPLPESPGLASGTHSLAQTMLMPD